FRPSMLQDVDRGRPTEIDALNGYVVAKGRELGIPTLLNEAIVRLVGDLPVDPEGPDRTVVNEELARLHPSLIGGLAR
ncbi:MAG TPA: ketopantoate reductase C-terminal domain-containing protein, partial [Solirubrobacterales bacterium]|nr:ketopantoate reductase C-terminal domain-containing protein [Solirubrobacterales bacterium]